MIMAKTTISTKLNITKNVCHSLSILETIIRMEMHAYMDAITMFNHLLICGFRKIERNIIKIGTIKITEKVTKIPGDVGPIGV